MNILILLVIITFVVIAILKRYKSSDVSFFPYVKNNYLLSKAEKSFYHVLQNCLNDSYVVFPKVRLGDIFNVHCRDKSKFYTYRNKIFQKHIDFLICDKQNFSPLAAIELDDSSHLEKEKEDNFKNNVFLSAGLPYISYKGKLQLQSCSN